MELQSLLGITAGLLSFSAYLLYIFSALFGQTRPNRVTWWVLTLVGVLIASSYYAGGARNTIWIAFAYVAGPLIVAIVSIWKGEGGADRFDLFCLAVALASILLWIVTDSALLVLLINIVVDFFGLLPTIKKSYLRPEGEDRRAWILESLASTLNLAAIERWSFAIWVYPLYLVVLNSIITALLFRKIK